MTAPIPIKHSPFIDGYYFRPFDCGLLVEVINEDGNVCPVLIPGTFIDGLWHNGPPVLNPERTIKPNPNPDFYAAHGCNTAVELKDTPFAEQYGSAAT